MFKFYIPSQDINLDLIKDGDEIFDRINKDKFIVNNDIYDWFFFLHFLPERLKIKFLNNVINQEEKQIYINILNFNSKLTKNIEESDFVILKPNSHLGSIFNCLNDKSDIIKEAQKLDKKVLFFYHSDFDFTPVNLPKNLILFTSPGFNNNSKNVYGLPTFSLDYFDEIFLKNKLSLSFCGNAKSHNFRFDVIKILKQKDYSDFILRNDTCGYNDEYILQNLNKHFYTIPPPLKEKNEFIENLKNNLYGLCVRGAGNYSYRLGEIFMMGRIPVLIDSECILPFREYIPYNKNCVYIQHKDLSNIDVIIKNYHNKHTENQLLSIQRQNRKIWLKYFTCRGAFNSTLRLLKDKNK